jgi:pimeloyl-ACP methyl ester carboxylesterase
MRAPRLPFACFVLLLSACSALAPDGSRSVTTEHYVTVKSGAPGLRGGETRLYVREISPASSAIPAANRVVLFVHGSGTPAEVTFDVRYKDYSWMQYLANAGFDTFSLSLTGYGGSTRPAAMADACNFSKATQAQFVPGVIPQPCEATYKTPIATYESEWNEIDAAVEHMRKLRGVDKVSIVGWSQGAARAGGYAARNPGKVARLFILAPSYMPDWPAAVPASMPADFAAMGSQSRKNFDDNWKRQVGCPDQYDQAAADAVWRDMLASDPVGAKWGDGIRRAPNVPNHGFNKAMVSQMNTPFAMVSGPHDKQIPPERVRALYRDLGSKDKVFIDLACTSHNAMWEPNRLLLYRASLEWLRDGKVNGVGEGEVRLGY